jgi:hypothetical protein
MANKGGQRQRGTGNLPDILFHCSRANIAQEIDVATSIPFSYGTTISH